MTLPASESAELLSRFQQLHPKSIDLSLDRVKHLLSALDDPHLAMPPVVHVAGTNGKGSTIAFLRAICEAAGLRVHVYTSPHLRCFNERIALAGPAGAAPIGERVLADVLRRTEAANDGNPITFFESITAAAMLAFAEHPADLVLLETGLGGRLDATNIIDHPKLSVITPISVDHTSFLGETIQAIAGEKAGIMKPGAPCIIARQNDMALGVLKMKAHTIGASPIIAGEQWDAYEQHGRLVFQDGRELLDLPLPRLAGRYQLDNAGTAVAAARSLHGFSISEQHLAEGLTSAQWPARMELLTQGTLHEVAAPGTEIWLDGGHNPAAGEVLARAMADLEERVSRPLHLILGMMSTKDAGSFLDHFHDLTSFIVTVDIPGQPNAFTAQELCAMARYKGFFSEPAADLRQALELSFRESKEPVRILIAGSLYLSGHVLEVQEQGLNA